ncbi:MAG: hypothetical protein IPO43_19360 [Rhodoferax sp.]|nr:hypothetical protein [Rhodoferax sp.]
MITIDGVAYSQAELSDTTKQQLGNVRLVDQELAQLHAKSQLAQAARAAFALGVKQNLPKRAPASSGA